jgi:predicted RNase H-like HicB family nuclease
MPHWELVRKRCQEPFALYRLAHARDDGRRADGCRGRIDEADVSLNCVITMIWARITEPDRDVWGPDSGLLTGRGRCIRRLDSKPVHGVCFELPGGYMKNEFTAIIERDGEWYVAYCPEIPGANGQGRTKDEVRENLADAIELILTDRREDALRGVPPDAIRETVTVK